MDNMGVLGGLLAGFFLTLAVAPSARNDGSYEQKCRIFGWTFCGI